jgi:outer membrane protein TolC
MTTFRFCLGELLLASVLATEPGFNSSSIAETAAVAATNTVAPIDLAAVLRLAGAQNLDIQISRERLSEARAISEGTVWQFFPWISPGIAYRRHDNLTQDVAGNIVDVHKESYAVGPAIAAQVDLGDAIYRNLASRQLVNAADFALESQRQDSLLFASQAYFDLVKAHSAVGVASEASRISTNYLGQIQRAADAGLAFRGDVLRVQVQADRDRIGFRQAQEQEQVASAKLVQVLHLPPAVELTPNEQELTQLTLIPTNAALSSLVAQALSKRPELKQSQAFTEAARDSKNGAVYGPLIPSVSAQVFAGGFGGGRDGAGSTFGESEDYLVALGWRIGPGGLFDRSRVRATEARVRIADLAGQKLQDEITRQVIENHTRSQSLADQLLLAQRAAGAAAEALRFSQERTEFAVGNELSNAIAEHNKAQYGLARAIGGLSPQN